MWSKVRVLASFVRISHTVFALPFALTGAMLAARHVEVTLGRVVWILVAMVAARSAAMGFNRIVDARLDALNPRTASRDLPAGRLSRREAAVFVSVSAGIFVGASYALGFLCFVLSPVALAIVFWYSLAKRVTWSTQAFLGLAMGVAPIGGWLAAGGRGGGEPWMLALAIGTWVGGFDILYACQDLEFDHAHGLKSVPQHFGVPTSLAIARAMHVVTVACLASLAWIAGLGWIYLAGVAGVAALLGYEQSLVSPRDLSQVKRAFDLNGYVGILYFLTTAIAIHAR